MATKSSEWALISTKSADAWEMLKNELQTRKNKVVRNGHRKVGVSPKHAFGLPKVPQRVNAAINGRHLHPQWRPSPANELDSRPNLRMHEKCWKMSSKLESSTFAWLGRHPDCRWRPFIAAFTLWGTLGSPKACFGLAPTFLWPFLTTLFFRVWSSFFNISHTFADLVEITAHSLDLAATGGADGGNLSLHLLSGGL